MPTTRTGWRADPTSDPRNPGGYDTYDTITGELPTGPSRRPSGRRGGRIPRITRTGTPRRRRTSWGLIAALLALTVFVAGIATGRWSTNPEATMDPGYPGAAPAAPKAGATTGASNSGRTEAGAVAAATATLLALTSREYVIDPAARVRILARVATADDVAALSERVGRTASPAPGGDPAAAAFAPTGVSVWRLIPVGHNADDCNRSVCTVRIWSVQVSASTGRPSAPAIAVWGTTTVPMRWQDGAGWRARVGAASTITGPTPGLGLGPNGAPSSDLDVVATGRGFTAYADASALTGAGLSRKAER